MWSVMGILGGLTEYRRVRVVGCDQLDSKPSDLLEEIDYGLPWEEVPVETKSELDPTSSEGLSL